MLKVKSLLTLLTVVIGVCFVGQAYADVGNVQGTAETGMPSAAEGPRASRFRMRSFRSAGDNRCSRARSRNSRASSMRPSDACSSA